MSTEDGGGSADEAPLPLAIVGGGIGGLVLALCLDQAYNHPEKDDANSDAEAGDKLPIVVYESTSAYRPDAGAPSASTRTACASSATSRPVTPTWERCWTTSATGASTTSSDGG